jgi:hypothetical protein
MFFGQIRLGNLSLELIYLHVLTADNDQNRLKKGHKRYNSSHYNITKLIKVSYIRQK